MIAALVLCGLGSPASLEALGRKGSTGEAAPPPAAIALAPVITRGLESPLFLTHPGDGSGRLFVLEQPGRIRVIKAGALLAGPFLDITDLVSFGGERGLLGLAFHPRYPENGRFFVNYSRASDGATIVAQYRVSSDPDKAGRDGRIILVVSQPYGNHNGGMVAFGPDGYLYIGMGDGGAAGDPGNRAQDRQALLGKLLRIDVDRGDPYAVPADNPLASGEGRAEIFATGLRNPWRYSFDRRTGRLWAADVGQNAWEEVDIVRRGGNYGWRIMEGAHCFLPPFGCDTSGLELPVAEYRNGGARCSITGGYVYRGQAHRDLNGVYLFGDYCSGEIFGFAADPAAEGTVISPPPVLLETDSRISSFGEDEHGELYVVDHTGGIYKIVQPTRD